MSTKTNDVYAIKLDEAIEALQSCQKDHHLKSCSECEKYLECELRKQYVKVVYESMSRGDTGGFEF